MKAVIDIESSDLLQNGLDYSSMPFKLKDTYKIWCIVVRDIGTNKVTSLVLVDCTKEKLAKVLEPYDELIGHNIVGFDFPVLSLMGLLDYKVGYVGQSCTVNGKTVEITDTLIWSKLLNPDRRGGHSLDDWGKRLGNYKQHFTDFSKYTSEMLEYCIQDTSVNASVYKKLMQERGTHNWSQPYELERKLVDLTLKQEVFGFDFDVELALKNLEELDVLMSERADRVTPILPSKKLTQAKLKHFEAPSVQFKKNGELSSHMLKFIEKHSCTVDLESRTLEYKGKTFSLPLKEPLETTEKATIDDIDVVKGYLLSLGWEPSEVKERDLVKNADKSVKNKEQIIEAIERYVKQTDGSLFEDLRCDQLGITKKQLKDFLMSKIDGTKPIYVPTTPKLQVGVEKEICPNLELLGEKAEFVKDVCEYFTYRLRLNSIAGGSVDEDGEPLTGFMSAVREDGRIPTPADTLGANTGRYRHKIVCNIPRVTSLYGEQMRSLFGCGKGLYQLGYDFASLEARIQGHYCIPYRDGVALAASLIAEKPNDIHSINARKLGIDRSSAKSFSYACMYGAQPKKLGKMLGITEKEAKRLYEQYWDAVIALQELKTKLEKHWADNDKQWVLGIDGRKIMSRSKHSLINVLFQSGGAIYAKYVTVLIAQQLEDLGLLGNPFCDSIEDVKVWMMTCVHDEAQMAVHPSLLKIKNFKDDEEAKQNLQAGCSAIGHGTKGSYVGYRTKIIEVIENSVKVATKALNIRVEMGFEWGAGLTWAQTH